jgi:hypothetical protein
MLVFLPALLLYVSTLAPSITWAHAGADGGDLISAAVTRGVAHPPGYPTYVTLGQIAAQIPIGTVAYRFNLMSAVCMALAAGLTALTLARLGSLSAAVVSGLYFATAPLVWSQAVITEVHALNALIVAATMAFIAPGIFRNERIPPWRLALAFGLWGTGFGNSPTVAALSPLMIVVWYRSIAIGRWMSLLALCLGLSVYALVPLRALAQPPINWGNAVTLPNIVAQISAEMYRGYTLAIPLNELPARGLAVAQLVVAQYGWLGVILGTIGLGAALSSSNRNWRWLALTLLLYLLFAVSYNTGDSSVYLIPVWMFGAWAIARGISVLERASVFQAKTSLRASALLLVLIFGPVFNAVSSYSIINLHDDHAATDFARSILASAPANAVVVTENDAHTFTFWYGRFGEQQRPDLAVVDRRLSGYSWYDSMLSAQGNAPQLPAYDPQDTWPARLAEMNPARIICMVDAASAQLQCNR